MRGRLERGATLIELVIAIVVIAIAASAVLGVLSAAAGRSADAMVLAQGVAIAEAYLEEIALKPLADPDGVDGEAARAEFDDVDDYDALVDDGAHDQFGTALPSLAAYTVQVSVSPSAALPGVPAAAARRIDVRVTHPPGVVVALTGYRL
jgi:MSHA pilin protein MshD